MALLANPPSRKSPIQKNIFILIELAPNSQNRTAGAGYFKTRGLVARISFTGGIIGALVGSGIPEARAKVYKSRVKKGNIVLGVKPRNDEDAEYFQNNWRENKGSEIHW